MIYLKYAIWNNSTKTFDWSTEQSFNELKFIENPNVKRLTSTTNRQKRINHIMGKFSVWSLVISADELADSTKYGFLISMFQAFKGKFSTNTNDTDRWGVSDTTVKEFTIEADKYPVEFLENCKLLPKVTFELFQKEAV